MGQCRRRQFVFLEGDKVEMSLDEAAIRMATSIRMGDGIRSDELLSYREKLAASSDEWRLTGAVKNTTVAILLELYPAIVGSLDLYPDEERQVLSDLAERILDELIAQLTVTSREPVDGGSE
jgi:hypothetical protein